MRKDHSEILGYQINMLRNLKIDTAIFMSDWQSKGNPQKKGDYESFDIVVRGGGVSGTDEF